MQQNAIVPAKPTFLDRLFGRRPAAPAARETLSVQVVSQGSSGTEIYSGYFAEEYLSELTGRQAIDVYDKMRRSDADVKMILTAVKGPVKRASWELEAASDAPEHQLQRDLIEQILFRDVKPGWRQILGEALTIVEFGHAVFEVTHQLVEPHPKFGSYVGLKKLGWRSPKTIERWNVDQDGELVSISQYAYGDLDRRVEIPGQHLVVMSLDREGDNYEGISGLRACYGAWWRKQLYLKLMAIGTEKHAVPPPVLEVPSGATAADRSLAKDALEKYSSNESNYLMMPGGWKLDFMKNAFDPEKVKTCVNFENTEMIRAFVANFLDLGSSAGGQGGSYALSFDQSDFFLGALEHLADLIAAPFNEVLIPQLVKLNFGPQESYPRLKASGISDKAGKELAESLKMLAEGRYVEPDLETEEHLRKRFGLPKKGTTDVRKAAAAVPPPGSPPGAGPAPDPAAEASKKKALSLAEKKRGKVKFKASGDADHCPTCFAFDGKVFDFDDAPELPLHPNCECELEPVDED